MASARLATDMRGGGDWPAMLTASGLAGASTIIVFEPSAVASEARIVAQTHLLVWKEHLAFHTRAAAAVTTLPDERALSTTYLRHMRMHRFPEHFVPFVDLFATGCRRHLQGERCAGFRVVAQVLNAVGGPAEKSALDALLKGLSGNELRFIDGIDPCAELRELGARIENMPCREAPCAR